MYWDDPASSSEPGTCNRALTHRHPYEEPRDPPGGCSAALSAYPSLQPAHLPLVAFLGQKLGQGVGSLSCPVKCVVDMVLSSLPSALPRPSVSKMATDISHDQFLSQATITCVGLSLLAACADPLAGYAHPSNGSSHPKLQRLHQTAAPASLEGPALTTPSQPRCCCLLCFCAAVALRWALTASLRERMICSASA